MSDSVRLRRTHEPAFSAEFRDQNLLRLSFHGVQTETRPNGVASHVVEPCRFHGHLEGEHFINISFGGMNDEMPSLIKTWLRQPATVRWFASEYGVAAENIAIREPRLGTSLPVPLPNTFVCSYKRQWRPDSVLLLPTLRRRAFAHVRFRSPLFVRIYGRPWTSIRQSLVVV